MQSREEISNNNDLLLSMHCLLVQWQISDVKIKQMCEKIGFSINEKYRALIDTKFLEVWT